ncbi:MAG: vWA domain-containing protein [Bryobacteraceae bacterium]
MFFFNLTFAQFLALFGSAGAVTVALYLFDRARRRQTVATLRFWVASEQPVQAVRRKRIQQPWSLLIQLASLALLLLAIAQLRIGPAGGTPFDHVLILEASAWMAARTGPRTLMDEARERAAAYVRALPAADRVMILRADGLATPATPFESDRRKIQEAISLSRPGATALNLEQALDFARQVQARSARRSGEIVFAGTGRISGRESESGSAAAFPSLRLLPVADAIENCGLRKISLRRAASGAWEIFVSARNYGLRPQTADLALHFGGAPVGSRRLALPPGAEQEAGFQFRTRAAGNLEVRLLVRDAFPDDDRALVELPPESTLAVAVYSAEPELLRPMLEANPRVQATFHAPAEYSPKTAAGLVILDRFRPSAPPEADSLWIDPPASASPIPVARRLEGARLTAWSAEHPLGAGLRTRDFTLDSASSFQPQSGDVRIAEADGGPVIVARPGKPKIVVLGFHPSRSAMRYELATPLLFANTLRWTAPDLFRRTEVAAGSAGAVTTPVNADLPRSDLRVVHEDGRPLPFTLRDGRLLQFFSGTRGTVRVVAGDREIVYSLTLPELGEAKWNPPAGVKRGVPGLRETAGGAADLWPLLACLGGLGLLAEWIVFGSARRGMLVRAVTRMPARRGWRELFAFAGRGRR